MNQRSKLKIGLAIWLAMLVLSFSISFFRTETPTRTESSPRNSNEISLTKRQWTIKGKNAPVTFEKDLETSLKIQKTPRVWLAFIDENRQTVAVDISTKAAEFIEKRWTKTLEYSYKNYSAADRETKIEINKNYLNDTAVFAQKLEIATSSETRKISLDEGLEIMNLVAVLAIGRYEELRNMASQVNSQKITFVK